MRTRSKHDATPEAWALLRRMKDDLRLISTELTAAVRAWFAALSPAWSVDVTPVNDDGVAERFSDIVLQPVRTRNILAAPFAAHTPRLFRLRWT